MNKKQPKTNKVSKQSPDLRQGMLDKLKKLYPPLFDNEGMLNQEELEQLVKDFSTPQTEKYEFNWAGKQQSKKKAFTASKATLRSDEKRSVDFNKTENLVIEGDNLEVLKLLQKSYFGKIKCIYIDPPYNTGNDFIYSDNYSEDKQAYWEKSGVKQDGLKLDTNTDSSGRYHSDWLSMMTSRLLLSRNLLREDGLVMISIDDNEVHNLRKLMDEIYGEENFISQTIWQKKYTTSNNIQGISAVHEYVLIYGKSIDEINNAVSRLPYSEEARARYKNPDNDERGDWMDVSYHGPKSPTERPNLNYPIIHPKTKKEVWPKEKSWAYEKDVYKQHLKENKLWWGMDNTYEEPRLKRFFSEMEDGIVPKSLWTYKEAGSTSSGRAELRELFGKRESGVLFDNPKPTKLIKKLLEIGSHKEDSIVLDFFAGSGTTAHAVMDLNKEDGGNRKFILVQIPEATDEKSEAYKAGYKTISDICIERVKRAGEKLTKSGKQQKLIDEGKDLDVGFKVFKLASSHFPENTFAPDPDKIDEENKKALEAYIKKATSQKGLFKDGVVDLVYEIALKDGFELTLKMDKVKDFDKNTVYKVSDSLKEAFICVDDSLEDATIKQLENYKDQRFICLHTSVNTTKKWNLQNVLGSNLWLV